MALLLSYVDERNEVYKWQNSYEKTIEIVELDRRILEVAGCQFPDVTINFIGDSITEGVGGLERPDKTRVSYVDYVQEYLGFGECINNGLIGRLIGVYPAATEYSISLHEEELFNPNADITVLFAGANDYFIDVEPKDWGVLDDGLTGGYCGQA